jgi:hypothetical protein
VYESEPNIINNFTAFILPTSNGLIGIGPQTVVQGDSSGYIWTPQISEANTNYTNIDGYESHTVFFNNKIYSVINNNIVSSGSLDFSTWDVTNLAASYLTLIKYQNSMLLGGKGKIAKFSNNTWNESTIFPNRSDGTIDFQFQSIAFKP